MSITIEHRHSSALDPATAAAVRSLCDAAYDTATAPYFTVIGSGDHLLGRRDGILVSHLLWVTRWLQVGDRQPLRTAYVEMVATAPGEQRRGHASALLEHFPRLVPDHDLAALCPATERLYARLGWRFWRGPLFARKDGSVIATPDERVMLLPLPRTPPLDFDLPLSIEWRPGEVW